MAPGAVLAQVARVEVIPFQTTTLTLEQAQKAVLEIMAALATSK
jgi:hypothetical protein